jgi:hypothetical protein
MLRSCLKRAKRVEGYEPALRALYFDLDFTLARGFERSFRSETLVPTKVALAGWIAGRYVLDKLQAWRQGMAIREDWAFPNSGNDPTILRSEVGSMENDVAVSWELEQALTDLTELVSADGKLAADFGRR